MTAEYVAEYDSLEYPVMGSRIVDSIQLKRISAQASEATIRHAQKILGTARRVISEDGKRMTITYRGEAEQGQIHNVAVYTKQEN